MKSSILKQPPISAVTSLERYLPGLAPSAPDTPIHPPNTCTISGWWVKRSATQVTDADGQPIGFRHKFMQARKTITSGVGADTARTFQQQADFLNARDDHAR